jgi:undecaprenyl-phosphate galactose phosphotransferase
MPIFKRYSKKLLFKFDCFKQKILVIGEQQQVEVFKQEILKNWYLGQEYNNNKYHSVIIISKGLETNELNSLIEQYLHKHSELFVVPYLENINFVHSTILEYANIRLNTIQVENKLLIKKIS